MNSLHCLLVHIIQAEFSLTPAAFCIACCILWTGDVWTWDRSGLSIAVTSQTKSRYSKIWQDNPGIYLHILGHLFKSRDMKRYSSLDLKRYPRDQNNTNVSGPSPASATFSIWMVCCSDSTEYYFTELNFSKWIFLPNWYILLNHLGP